MFVDFSPHKIGVAGLEFCAGEVRGPGVVAIPHTLFQCGKVGDSVSEVTVYSWYNHVIPRDAFFRAGSI